MSHPPFQQALTEAELDRLTGFLDAIGSPAMNRAACGCKLWDFEIGYHSRN
ncbi:hypothetical protein [Pseudomonas syringae]|uniref:hypothetical protein n=1 Tax=Pseudomonas syringae TaxID=317 RepID=UPI001FF91248|nr:hypothetical protein [Pseudomonas syringae]